MTPTVVSLDAERSKRRRPRECQRCEARADGTLCYPHRLDALAYRLREALDEGAALVPAEALIDALAVVDGITGECLTATERSTTR